MFKKNMEILNTINELRLFRQNKHVAFVPTMGALHEGHLSLIDVGLSQADICIPYIFLNPKQFAEHEDLDKYPSTLDRDIELCRDRGAQAVYIPQVKEVYPDSFATQVTIDNSLTSVLEGEIRPHFFQGVTTVLTKMFLHCMPDIALFGEKDYQQLLVIKKLVADLDFPIDVIGVETARDINGLALSSRNTYLSQGDYKIAIQMNKILEDISCGIIDSEEGCEHLLSAGFDTVDYCTVRDASTLQPINNNTTEKRVLTAATLNGTRLIDNMAIKTNNKKGA